MEQKSNKIQIPKKTKLAAKIMTIAGIYLFIGVAFSLFEGQGVARELINILVCFFIVAIGLIYLIMAVCLFGGSLIVWKIAVAFIWTKLMLQISICLYFYQFALDVFSMEMYAGVRWQLLLFYAILIFPDVLIGCLLFFDRKNYFAAVERARNDKGEG